MAFKDTPVFINWFIFLNVLLNCCKPTNSLKIQNLGGYWTVENDKRGYELPAIVPGGIYTDLMKNGIIEDVFYKFNDVDTRWVSKLDWNYTKWFTVHSTLLDHNNINLVFNGIDTFAEISINGNSVGVTENMFIRYVFDIKPYLKHGNNTIKVQFQSPVNVARTVFEIQARKYIVPPLCVPPEYHGECHVNHIRKMQASFAWDWGPAFPSVGVWKPVYIEAFNSSKIRDVTVEIHSHASTNRWGIVINTYLASTFSDSIQGSIMFKLYTDVEKLTFINTIDVKKNENGEFLFTKTISIPKTYVKLWWPNGYGKASLYKLQVYYISPNQDENSLKAIKIGFRTVELVQNAIEHGRTFYFKVNGIPIFAKGSNVIPINILPELGQNESTVRFLLESAKVTHMNMLRVWGGGVYESDIFYKVADELGLMIWQDFMFACSMYPTMVGFLSSVKDEVRHQVRRLQYHPSIVLWAGNNENEQALRGDWYGTGSNFSVYHDDYVQLYIKTVKSEVLQNDNTRSFLTSSPTNGVESEKEDYIAEDPGSNYYGDVHFYNYIVDGFYTPVYPINRFASEYGYQSLPSIDTLLTATNNSEDLNIYSKFLLDRQHHGLGYEQMRTLISYQLPLSNKNDEDYYKFFIFYSQIIQAMSIKIETEYYRTWRSRINDAGEGLTMGALYWQLNDVWVAPSWASIDFKNSWKMLHYYTKQFFAPIIATAVKNIPLNSIDVFIVSDLLQPVHNASLSISTFRWNSFIPVNHQSLSVDVLPGFSQQITTLSLSFLDLAEPCGIKLQNCFFYFTLENSKKEAIAPNNFIFPTSLKSAILQKPEIEIINIKQIDNSSKLFSIEVNTNTIALFVWLEVKGVSGIFSDNGFLQVTPVKIVRFAAHRTTTVQEIEESIEVFNLFRPDGL